MIAINIIMIIYGIQLALVLFCLVTEQVFETKKEFLLSLIPFYFIYYKYNQLN